MNRLVTNFAAAIAVIGATTLIIGISLVVYYFGYITGYNHSSLALTEAFNNYVVESEASSLAEPDISPLPTPVPRAGSTPAPVIQVVTWGGPDLWDAVNKRRVELGVSGLGNRSDLCTIASIRLNELLELGKLDGHEGFSNMTERRPDLLPIFEKYNISEFLVSGATSATNAVNLWENTLGHRQLVAGGEYVWGCTYAQNGFGVAIAAY